MHSHSSISSSSFSATEAQGPYTIPAPSPAILGRRVANAWSVLSAAFKRCPSGGRWAVAIVIGTHLVLSYVVFPYPVAQERVRHKVFALTTDSRPGIVAAGDSRALCHIVPSVLTNALGIAPDTAANLALQTCDVASVAAWYRELSHRVSDAPIMIVSVSAWMVGPRGHGRFEKNREYHAGRSLRAVAGDLGFSKAARVVLTPEWTLIDRIAAQRNPDYREVKETQRGFDDLPSRKWPPQNQDLPRYVVSLQKWGWFREANDSDAAWKQLRQNLEFLLSRGVQLVILDSPDHPALSAYLKDEPGGIAQDRFRERLSRLCTALTVPLLRYNACDLDDVNPERLFFDGVHLDKTGAAILTAMIANDLKALINQGTLRLPPRAPLRSCQDELSGVLPGGMIRVCIRDSPFAPRVRKRTWFSPFTKPNRDQTHVGTTWNPVSSRKNPFQRDPRWDIRTAGRDS